METELVSGGVAADLQRLTGRHRERRTPARVERIAIRDEHAERVVAAAQIHDDEIAEARALGQRDVAEKSRRRKAERKRRHAAPHEVASGVFHTSWYSEDPTIRCSSPGAFTRSCASVPVHSGPPRRYASSAS